MAFDLSISEIPNEPEVDTAKRFDLEAVLALGTIDFLTLLDVQSLPAVVRAHFFR